MFPFKDVAAVEHIDTPLSNEMIDALDLWYKMYTDSPPWLSSGKVKSLNLPSLICSEIARQVLLRSSGTSAARRTKTAMRRTVPAPST